MKEVDTLTMEALLKECSAMGEEEEDNLSEAEEEHTELGWEEENEWLPPAGPGWKVASVKFGEEEIPVAVWPTLWRTGRRLGIPAGGRRGRGGYWVHDWWPCP